MSVQETNWDTETKFKTVSYQEQEPYTTTESYTEKEPYTDTETTYKTESYQDEECKYVYPSINVEWGEWSSEYYVAHEVVFTNGEDQSASLTTTVYFFDSSATPYADRANTETW